MSRKRRDVTRAATSQLLPQAASRHAAMRNMEERRVRSKAHYDKRLSGPLKLYTPGRKELFLQQWNYGEEVEQSTSRSRLVKTAMGPVRRIHAQIRAARTEPAERKIIEMDQFENASTESEQEQESNQLTLSILELDARP